MQKIFIVRLTEEERNTLQEVVKKRKGTSQKVQRAQILLKCDAGGPAWTDYRIAEAFSCRRRSTMGSSSEACVTLKGLYGRWTSSALE